LNAGITSRCVQANGTILSSSFRDRFLCWAGCVHADNATSVSTEFLWPAWYNDWNKNNMNTKLLRVSTSGPLNHHRISDILRAPTS
jgi:hypothetical protein